MKIDEGKLKDIRKQIIISALSGLWCVYIHTAGVPPLVDILFQILGTINIIAAIIGILHIQLLYNAKEKKQ